MLFDKFFLCQGIGQILVIFKMVLFTFSMLLLERLMILSDAFEVDVCKQCGILGSMVILQ